MTHDIIVPRLGRDCFIHGSSVVMGNVTMGDECSVWPLAVIRGDENTIELGDRTNVQDGVIIHVDAEHPVRIGNDVSLGHGAIAHGCTIDDLCIIGIGSVVLNGCRIGKGCIIGAGAVVPPNTEIPPFSMVLGIPGKVKRTDPEFERMAKENADIYVSSAREHMEGIFRTVH